MNSEQLAAILHAGAVDELVATYEGLLRNVDRNKATDPYWQALLRLFDTLDEDGQAVLVRVMRQTSVDAVSSALSLLEVHDEDLAWSEIQDAFLLIEEEHPSNR
ncbi:hypothetical protein [Erythrobacter sp. CCH5-A1]|uniref:hypothetical protein n=1 Tax=Erythrobacter sp. CCH5-A1 TaxID=1768792 RepID=UPI000831EB05|nr:hypothetical protein [Erythrobacter sp. CCH5-A1]